MVSYHPVKCCDNKLCSSEYILVLVSLMVLQDYLIKDSFDLIGETPHSESHPCQVLWLQTSWTGPVPALFQNVFQFCIFLPKFSNILPFFALFLKNRMHVLTFQNRPCCQWRYKSFILKRDGPWNQRVEWHYGQELLKASYYPAMDGGHRYCGIGEIMDSVCHVI